MQAARPNPICVRHISYREKPDIDTKILRHGVTGPMPEIMRKYVQYYMPPSVQHVLSGFRRCGVPGDGSCLYHSVCAALNYKQFNEQDLVGKKDITYEFRCNLSNFISLQDVHQELRQGSTYRLKDAIQTPESLRMYFCDPTQWTDEVMIRCLQRFLNMNLIFWNCMDNEFYCGINGNRPFELPMCVIAWVNKKHFEPMLRTTKDGCIHHRRPGILPPGHPIHYAIMMNYLKLCTRIQYIDEIKPSSLIVPPVTCDKDNYCLRNDAKRKDKGKQPPLLNTSQPKQEMSSLNLREPKP